MHAYKDEKGKRYGCLTVLEKTDKRVPSNGCIVWKCRCDCGAICYVSGNNLRFGSVISCGCAKHKNKVI